MLIYVYVVLCLIYNTVKAQFPEHVDLEKVGEVEIHNEKYRILRPAIHNIKDHFKDFINRRETNTDPNERVLMDHNGFRHFWSTISNSRKNSKLMEDKDNSEDKVAEDDKAEDKDKTIEITTISTTTTKRRRPRPKKVTKEDVMKAIRERWAQDQANAALRQADTGKKLYLVETTFFCPFFGIVNTRHYLNESDALKAVLRK